MKTEELLMVGALGYLAYLALKPAPVPTNPITNAFNQLLQAVGFPTNSAGALAGATPAAFQTQSLSAPSAYGDQVPTQLAGNPSSIINIAAPPGIPASLPSAGNNTLASVSVVSTAPLTAAVMPNGSNFNTGNSIVAPGYSDYSRTGGGPVYEGATPTVLLPQPTIYAPVDSFASITGIPLPQTGGGDPFELASVLASAPEMITAAQGDQLTGQRGYPIPGYYWNGLEYTKIH